MTHEKNYKYTITINQKAYKDLNIIISYELAALLYYLIEFCTSQNEKIEKQRDGNYTWINYKKILKDMPLLKGRTIASLTGKINRLERMDLIKTKIITYKGRPRKYILLTDLCDKIKCWPEGDYDENKFKLFLKMGMNERQAVTIAMNKKFLTEEKALIHRVVKSKRLVDEGAYLWERFAVWRNLDKYSYLFDETINKGNDTTS